MNFHSKTRMNFDSCEKYDFTVFYDFFVNTVQYKIVIIPKHMKRSLNNTELDPYEKNIES